MKIDGLLEKSGRDKSLVTKHATNISDTLVLIVGRNDGFNM